MRNVLKDLLWRLTKPLWRARRCAVPGCKNDTASESLWCCVDHWPADGNPCPACGGDGRCPCCTGDNRAQWRER